MNIEALKPFVLRDSISGKLTSFACGAVYSVSDSLGNELIEQGLAKEREELIPTGSINIVANGTYNISAFATANVTVGVYTVTYDLNGGSGSAVAQTVIAGNSLELDNGAGITPAQGKSFLGWATTAEAEEPDVTSPYTPTANVTLYAVYLSLIEVSYNVNGGSGTVTSDYVLPGESVTLDDGAGITPPTGKLFVGWATTAEAEEPNVESPYTPAEDVTLYAVYKVAYTVTYNANGGTGSILPVTVLAGESVTLDDGASLTAPEGKTFGGWATTSEAITSDVSSPYTPNADITLFAVWTNL